jgi:hypothetical protein
VGAALFADLDVEALDLLVERGERDAELLGGVGLVPVAALELLDDDAALDVFEDVEERGVGVVLEQRVLEAAAGDVAGQQSEPMMGPLESTTPRSMEFSSSRTLPGQS